MVALRAGKGVVRIELRAQPRASRNGVVGVVGDRLKVAVTASPTDGRANAAIEKVLASALGLRPSAVRILTGQASRDKTVEVEGMPIELVRQRLGALLSSS
jgi:uncharacterized protein (TIGR00251 family)